MQKFWIQLISIVAIILVTITYNATVNKRISAENIEKEKYQNALDAINSTENTESSALYNEGIYDGEATGFGGLIKLEVTIKDGKIDNINVLSHDDEDEAYYNLAESVIDDILNKQSTDVDVASGATFSSKGIINAVENALEKAGN